ncbi:hypothetical protein MRX96_030702 [Rhipicephalus microplus]
MSVDGPRRRTQRTNCPSAAKAASRKAAHGASERRARQSAEPTCSELSGVIPSSRGLPRVLEQRAKAHVERSLPSLGLAVCGTGRATNSRRRAPRPGRRGVGGFRTRAPNRGRHSRSSGPEKCEKKWEFSGSCPCTLGCRSPKGVAASSRSETAPIVAPKGAGDKYFSPGRCSTITGLTAICSCADKWCPGRLLHTNANRLRQNISLLFADGLLPERRK